MEHNETKVGHFSNSYFTITSRTSEYLELEVDSGGYFTLSCLDQVVRVLTLGLWYILQNSRYHGV